MYASGRPYCLVSLKPIISRFRQQLKDTKRARKKHEPISSKANKASRGYGSRVGPNDEFAAGVSVRNFLKPHWDHSSLDGGPLWR